MARNYNKLDAYNRESYESEIDSIKELYSTLSICGIPTSNNPTPASLIAEPPIFFYEPIKSEDPSMCLKASQLNKTMQTLIKHYNYKPLTQLYQQNFKLFFEVLRYGIVFETNTKKLEQFVVENPNPTTVTNSLKNVIYSTIECASYFHAATKVKNYNDPETLSTIYHVLDLATLRLNYAEETQSYHDNKELANETEFLNQYHTIQQFGLSLQEFMDFLNLEEDTLYDDLLLTDEPEPQNSNQKHSMFNN